MTSSSANVYDALAPHYREYSKKRAAYLDSVDDFISKNVPVSASSWLDVGSGDGVRAMALARNHKISDIILSDCSREMVERCRKLSPKDVWFCTAETLPAADRKFDIITALWNVLGHVTTRESRVNALQRMKTLLSTDGVIIFDVNNRHNAPAYGWLTVLGRILLDALWPDERRGDSFFEWKIGEVTMPARGHLFTPDEIESIIHDSGLKIIKRICVNYANGSRRPFKWMGQLVYILKSADA